jgi:hypothetical protein
VKAEVAGVESLALLRGTIASEGGELAAALVTPSAGEAFGPLVAASERCRDQAGEYALLVESILEGYLLHYGAARVFEPPDENLRLLAGDYLYALGLARLAGMGDLEAIRELADVIALCSQAQAGTDGPEPDAPEAVWLVGVLGVAGGSWREGEAAKQALREGRPGSAAEALEAASRRAEALGIGLEGERALIAFRELTSRDSRST